MLNSGKPGRAALLRRGAARPVRFAALFGALFLAGSGLILLPPVQAIDGRFSQALVGLSHRLIGICGGTAQVEGAILRAPGGFGVEMKDGCNGITVTILLCAAVLAFPAPWRVRGLGLVAGGLAIQILNIVRFISLFYLGQYSTTWFEFAHGYLWETLLMLDTLVVFWLWVGRVSRAGRVQDALN
jgi:exosortase H (IPTLxxWG-CTERM-specific)